MPHHKMGAILNRSRRCKMSESTMLDVQKIEAEISKLNADTAKIQAETMRIHEEMVKLRIDTAKAQHESDKVRLDSMKTQEETLKLRLDSMKVEHETNKIIRETFWYPIIAAGTSAGAMVAIVALFAKIL